jgi:hypothetical protein
MQIEEQQTYLGVTFDKRMTWKQHITSAEAMARRKMNIMRKLARTKWGTNEKILKSVYQGNVRPHLEYGSSSWMTAVLILYSLDGLESTDIWWPISWLYISFSYVMVVSS